MVLSFSKPGRYGEGLILLSEGQLEQHLVGAKVSPELHVINCNKIGDVITASSKDFILYFSCESPTDGHLFCFQWN